MNNNTIDGDNLFLASLDEITRLEAISLKLNAQINTLTTENKQLNDKIQSLITENSLKDKMKKGDSANELNPESDSTNE